MKQISFFIVSVGFGLLSGCSQMVVMQEPEPVDQKSLQIVQSSKPESGNFKLIAVDQERHFSEQCVLELESSGSFTDRDYGARKNDVVEGFGEDISIRLFARQIIPQEFKVYWQKEIPKDQRINWNGGGAWVHILNEIGRKYQKQFIVNVERRSVEIGWAAKDKGGVYYVGKGDTESQCIPYYEIREWKAQSGRLLTDVVSEWADISKWEVHWGVTDRSITTVDYLIVGDFVEAFKGLVAKSATDKKLSNNLVVKVFFGKKVIQIVESQTKSGEF